MPVRGDVGQNAKRRTQLVVAARVVEHAVWARAAAGADRTVHHRVRAGVTVQQVVVLVRVVDVMPEAVKLPAEAQIVLLAADIGQIASSNRNCALLLEILGRLVARSVTDGVEAPRPVQRAVRRESDSARRLNEPVTNLLRSEELLGLNGIQTPPRVHNECWCRREHSCPGNGVARVLVPFFRPLKVRIGGAVEIGQPTFPLREVRGPRSH